MPHSMHKATPRAQKSDRQQESMTLPLFDGRCQAQRLIDEQPPLSLPAVLAKPTLTAALKMCFEHPGLDDKQAASLMGLDAGQFSRIMGATAHFPTNRYVEFMENMGNDAPLIWLAHQRGYELRRIQSSLEQENEKLRAELSQERHDREVERNAFARALSVGK